MPARVESWRKRGYCIHLMTGVAWGEYQDYLYGRFDGVNHEDEAQTERDGRKIGHGGDVWYMSPGISYGKFLCVGVQRALDAGVEAVHLEEPEYWSAGGYNEAFKKDWQAHYAEPWQAQHESVDARWRSSKLKYFLYRRALQQVFTYIQDYNKKFHKSVRCYVPTHSLINYASWGIVSPESSLARLEGCDGYIAQVWTGTARTPNMYQGVTAERTFETAFLEYGAMMNLVRSTGRKVWFLADPVEDDANHDWSDYRVNWQATLTASLLHPDISSYEVMPWPERIYTSTYPSATDKKLRIPIPHEYASELANVTHALKQIEATSVTERSGTKGIGVIVSDSLMFQRGDPNGSDHNLGHFYGMAMPLVKAGIPIEPVQLESVTLPHYLDRYKLLYMSYRGQKPQTDDVHAPLASWVKGGGILVFIDDDGDPYNHVREWWNDQGKTQVIPRQNLFAKLGVSEEPGVTKVGRGKVVFLHKDPTAIAADPNGADRILDVAKSALGSKLSLLAGLSLRRGPFIIASGSGGPKPKHAVDLFDPELQVTDASTLSSCRFLIDLDLMPRDACYIAGPDLQNEERGSDLWAGSIEGQANVQGHLLLRIPREPRSITSDGATVANTKYDAQLHLLWLKLPLTPKPQKIEIKF